MLITGELAALQKEIEKIARDYGLTFPEVRYEMVDYKTVNLLAAYDGFPIRYPHWRFGMEYERLSKSYAYGLHRIYEMVINTEPIYAYLLQSNLMVDQKLVMAHVCGHADFFANNLWFAHTNRKMLDEVANHAARIRNYMDRFGQETVENFLDACLSLDNLIDIHAPGVQRRAIVVKEDETPQIVKKMKAKDYMDSYINPPEFLAEQQRRLTAEREQMKKFPAESERDVLLFLQEYAPLENWQRDVLGIVREEAYYFAPQRQTKIMNEGWAVFWHTRLMTNHLLQSSELIDYAEHHSGTVAAHPGRLNPYRLGYELFLDIEDRWNRGAFGPEYDNCTDRVARSQWDKKLGQGMEKVFSVRRIYNDVGFIDAFLTEEFARKHKLFVFEYNEHINEYEISSRDFQAVKQKLLFQLTNFGQPIVDVVDANYENRGELYLRHHYEGIDLDRPYLEATLINLYTIWNRPVHLETVLEDKGMVVFRYGPEGGSVQAAQVMDGRALLERLGQLVKYA
ncbi:MAG: SpoVR family protein [Chloroflexi bacterium]|nr:SpoVR family protein [Ardenticatenaceae bacterium]MBL1128007.1 SpoVR family protein [Chloroflexota bacterium]NOG34079.1 SpoVR family protein [Chloroflexota bacterium]GIK54497.1 MAG: stage V sporulation protein R [Chloroflexota bacterium]